METCPKCGARLYGAMRFCGVCGARSDELPLDDAVMPGHTPHLHDHAPAKDKTSVKPVHRSADESPHIYEVSDKAEDSRPGHVPAGQPSKEGPCHLCNSPAYTKCFFCEKAFCREHLGRIQANTLPFSEYKRIPGGAQESDFKEGWRSGMQRACPRCIREREFTELDERELKMLGIADICTWYVIARPDAERGA